MRAMERALEIGLGRRAATVESIEAIHREIAVVPPLDKIAGQTPRGAELDRRRRPEPRRIRRAAGGARCRPLLEDLCEFIESRRHLPGGAGGDRPRPVRDHPSLRRRQRPRRQVPDPGDLPAARAGAAATCRRSASCSARTRTPTSAGSKPSGRRRRRAGSPTSPGATETAALRARGFSPKRSRRCSRTGAPCWPPVRADAAALALIDLLPRFPIVTAAAAEGEIDRSRRATLTGLERLGRRRDPDPPPQPEEGRQLGGEGPLRPARRVRAVAVGEAGDRGLGWRREMEFLSSSSAI